MFCRFEDGPYAVENEKITVPLSSLENKPYMNRKTGADHPFSPENQDAVIVKLFHGNEGAVQKIALEGFSEGRSARPCFFQE